jgi:cold shock protein
MRGRVELFSNERGFGFIEVADDNDVFLPKRAVDRAGLNLLRGQRIEFDVVVSHDGRTKADNLRLVAD